MNKIELLKNLKKNLAIIGTLSVLGTTVFSNKKNVYANKNNIIEQNNSIINENANPFTFAEKITYYSNVFGLKEDVVYDHLDYLQNESENNEDFINLNADLKVLTTCRDIYYNNNYSEELTRNNKTYEVTLSPEEMIEKYAEIYDINKEVALSIVYCECGTNVDSYNYEVNNNPAGLGPSMYFENKEIGIIYFINLLKDSYGCTKDSGTEFLNGIASTYCEIPDHWLSLTLPLYNDLCNDYYKYKPELKMKKNTKTLALTNEKELD